MTHLKLAFAERPWRRNPDSDCSPDIYAASPEERAALVQTAFGSGIRMFHAAHEREAASLGISLHALGLHAQVLVSTTDGDALDRCPDTVLGASDAVSRAIDRKRSLLRTDRLDLFHLYDVRPETHTPERLGGAAAACDAARSAGRIGRMGATCYGAYDFLAEQIERGLTIDDLFVRFNYADRRAALRLLPACRERGIAVWAAQTFAWAGGVAFARFPATWRLRNLTKAFYGITAAQAHLRWIANHPVFDGVVVSMQTQDQMMENVEALKSDILPAGIESLFESIRQDGIDSPDGWEGLRQDDQWEVRAAAEAMLERGLAR